MHYNDTIHICFKSEKERYETQKESLRIKAPDSAQSILALSGGNQDYRKGISG